MRPSAPQRLNSIRAEPYTTEIPMQDRGRSRGHANRNSGGADAGARSQRPPYDNYGYDSRYDSPTYPPPPPYQPSAAPKGYQFDRIQGQTY
ncbi:aggrecan core protein-like isoform x4 [Plakobranchus ocellatus]|uniref:Aggrecan core protein-like isoform x4 n=1 Tax=Plakobranchus ocellatus TaxID=259542 RepID=A0AAV4AZQ0_9GAST|nr:aggrecan core protein-like isoform x4 [Plakobranchus ocellatus]